MIKFALMWSGLAFRGSVLVCRDSKVASLDSSDFSHPQAQIWCVSRSETEEALEQSRTRNLRKA